MPTEGHAMINKKNKHLQHIHMGQPPVGRFVVSSASHAVARKLLSSYGVWVNGKIPNHFIVSDYIIGLYNICHEWSVWSRSWKSSKDVALEVVLV